jgi:hypothetical protein
VQNLHVAQSSCTKAVFEGKLGQVRSLVLIVSLFLRSILCPLFPSMFTHVGNTLVPHSTASQHKVIFLNPHRQELKVSIAVFNFFDKIWSLAWALNFVQSRDNRSARSCVFSFKGAGGGVPEVMDHQNRFYDVFWKWIVIVTNCLLPHQKILILTKLMAGWRSALMCNSIARAIFNRDYLKILIFDLQNLSSSTFFEQSASYLAVIFLRQFRREWLARFLN